MKKKSNVIYIDSSKENAFKNLSDVLYFRIKQKLKSSHVIIILCIGTDRATGDSLGPLIGHMLGKNHFRNTVIYGSLDEPIHAKNLESAIFHIKSSYKNPLIIAIDASLGKIDHIGFITVSDSAIKPGAGVNKNLPRVGHISITGIVNFYGIMDTLVLQNTRLSVVMKMADIVATGIKGSIEKIEGEWRTG